MLHYSIDWLMKSGRKGHIRRRTKSFFMMTMHNLTHQTFRRQKHMNWVSNRFRIPRILQTWPPSDYYLFSTFKRWLCGRRFESNEEVE